jgi:Ca2+-binding EF-hand superfamily protein
MSRSRFPFVSPFDAATRESSMAGSTPSKALSMAALVLAAALAGTPLAQARVQGNFDDADTNHDGRVTLQEYETYVTNRLMSVDGPRAQRFKQLSPQEQAARLQQRFERLDTGHKGYLDRNDWNGS